LHTFEPDADTVFDLDAPEPGETGEMAKLEAITIKGFKSIAAIENLKLENINIVIGPNGSGKSNFIEVFSFLHAIRTERLKNYVALSNGADNILHFGSKRTNRLLIHLSFEGQKNEYKIVLRPTENDELMPLLEQVYFWDKASHEEPFKKNIQSNEREAGIASASDIGNYVRNHLDSWRVYHFHDTGPASPMKKNGKVNDNRFLRPDGANLAAFLYFLQLRHKASYSLIRRTVQRVAPFFDDFQLAPLQLNPEVIRLEWRHKNTDAYFDAASLSDGTLRFIALATLFLQPEALRPSVIFVDEPELGLHPYAISILAAIIKQASQEKQIIVSTQSPLLIDSFSPENVLVADRIDGGTVLSRLESEKLASWLEDYSLGQLWEKNELGGRPRAE
jgi:predicted ATPase